MPKILIVGGGIAGLSLAIRLFQRQVDFTLAMSPAVAPCTDVSLGVLNPIVFKRFTESWMAETLLAEAATFYREAESFTKSQFYSPLQLVKLIHDQSSIKQLHQRLEERDGSKFLRKTDFNSVTIEGAARLDCASFTKAIRGWLSTTGRLVQAHVEGVKPNEPFQFAGSTYDKVVFCEGHSASTNTHFDFVPWRLSKGEWIEVQCANDLTSGATHYGYTALKQEKGRYRIGSTFSWDELNNHNTANTVDGLRESAATPGLAVRRLTSAGAGIRPASMDRRPIMGRHPEHENIFMFNGFGTKGCLLAPYFSQHFADHMLNGASLMPEVDVRRFR